jgi:hypothetical protein
MFVQSFLALMAETDAGSFQKVLAIKTLRKPEELELLQAYAKETGTQLVRAVQCAGPSPPLPARPKFFATALLTR